MLAVDGMGINKVYFVVPAGWEVYNKLHEINIEDLPEDSLDRHNYFDEDLVQITTPEDITIDVGWLPSGEPNGRFVGVVFKGEFEWDNPIEKKEFKTWQEVKKWVYDWIEKLEK